MTLFFTMSCNLITKVIVIKLGNNVKIISKSCFVLFCESIEQLLQQYGVIMDLKKKKKIISFKVSYF